MTREEMRAYVQAHPIAWPPLSPTQRMRLAAVLRPDLPVGIRRRAPIREGDRDSSPREAA